MGYPLCQLIWGLKSTVFKGGQLFLGIYFVFFLEFYLFFLGGCFFLNFSCFFLTSIGFCWLLASVGFWLLLACGFCWLLASVGFWLLLAFGFCWLLASVGFWLLLAFGFCWLLAFSEENAPRRTPAAFVGFTFLAFSQVIRVLRSEVIVNLHVMRPTAPRFRIFCRRSCVQSFQK